VKCWLKQGSVVLVSLGIIALACSQTDTGKNAEKAHLAEQCKSLTPTEEQGWFDTSLSTVEVKNVPPDPRLTGSEATFVAVATVRGRGAEGARRSAQITCSVAGVVGPVDGGEPQPRVVSRIGQVVSEPISDADREWLRRQILQKASAAAAAQQYGEAVRVLKGNGPYKVDASLSLENDASYKVLLASVLKEEAKQKRTAAVEEARKQREDIKREREQAKEDAKERREYAHTLREHFLDTGSDIEVSVSGSNSDRLRLRYVLFNAV
jgi:hypothetical protein